MLLLSLLPGTCSPPLRAGPGSPALSQTHIPSSRPGRDLSSSPGTRLSLRGPQPGEWYHFSPQTPDPDYGPCSFLNAGTGMACITEETSQKSFNDINGSCIHVPRIFGSLEGEQTDGFVKKIWEQPQLNWKTALVQAGEASGMANSFSPLPGISWKPSWPRSLTTGWSFWQN